MSTFKGLPASDQGNVKFTEMNYYKWLSEDTIKDYHTINTRKRYLDSFGFVKGVDKLSESTIKNLKYCLSYHYDIFERPLNEVRFAYNDKVHNIRDLLLKRLSSYIVSNRITAKQYFKRVHILNLWALRKLK